jgi:hypothetical protein
MAKIQTETLDHDDFGLIQSKIIVIDSNKIDCPGKAAQRPTFPHPARPAAALLRRCT